MPRKRSCELKNIQRLSSVAATALLVCAGLAKPTQAQTVVDTSLAVLNTLTTQADRIPPQLLASAHGLAIVPSVVKGGFVVGIRRGHGIMMVRGEQGVWQPPSMITLTGGSVGWQVGIQSTDLVMVFKNKRSVENLMQGKLTIGVDASAAAGPVGRKAGAATDGKLTAEIYSYSRSRGLFAGVSMDGATLAIDQAAQQAYYATAPQGTLPPSTVRLLQRLNQFSNPAAGADAAQAAPGAAQPMPGAPAGQLAPPNALVMEQQLAQANQKLDGLVDPNWRAFLRIPLPAPGGNVDPKALQDTVKRYEQVAADPRYASLNRRPEFQQTLQLLRQYAAMRTAAAPVTLPPPPTR